MRLGIDLGGTKIEGIALDGGREAARVRISTPYDDYGATISAIARVVAELESAAGPGTVGVGIPGTISLETGLVKNANSIWLIGQPLQRDLERVLARDIRIANDANCFAVSEAADGAAAGAAVVFGVIVGTGTGAGVVVHGQLLVGPHGIAGEWGHNPMPWPDAGEWPGPPCYCGKTGCIEMFLSGPGLARDFSRDPQRGRPSVGVGEGGPGITTEAIVALAEKGDDAAEAALVRYEQRMARALASIINVLDPDVIVLGGGLSNLTRLYTNVPRYWGDFVFSASTQAAAARRPAAASATVGTRLVRAAHGDASGVRGAAWLWNNA
jgi:fructokinase